MAIRLRLALWYGALFALVLLLMALLSYSLHVRGHYDDRDRALVTSAGHMAGEARAMPNGPHLVEGSGGLEVGVRLYDALGVVREQTPDIASLPGIDPLALLRTPAGPAYDALAGLAPPLIAPDIPSTGAFGLIITPDQRWRVYVM